MKAFFRARRYAAQLGAALARNTPAFHPPHDTHTRELEQLRDRITNARHEVRELTGRADTPRQDTP